jgi:hypothetical protein
VKLETKAALDQLETGAKQKLSQAARVAIKFGGVTKLAKACDPPYDPSTCFKWLYPKSKQGTGGLIPSHAMKRVREAARREGILLTADDFFPGELEVK